MSINIQFLNGSDQKMVAMLRQKGPKMVEAVTQRVTLIMLKLQQYIVSRKLAGQVLSQRSGKLAASIRAYPAEVSGNSISAVVEGAGGPAFYGAIQERGGGKEFDIVPKSAKVLRFRLGGQEFFATKVTHPPLPARPFMEPSLEEMKTEIQTELQQVIHQVLSE